MKSRKLQGAGCGVQGRWYQVQDALWAMSGAGCRAGEKSLFICEICAMTKGNEVIEVMKIMEVMKL